MINDLTNTREANDEMHPTMIKRAWIDESKKLVSFHYIENAILFEEEKAAFWEHIKSLMYQEYRVQ